MHKLLSSNLRPLCRWGECSHTYTRCGRKIEHHIVAITTTWWRRSAYINMAPYMALPLLIQVTLVQECLVFAKAEANTAEHSANVVCRGTQRAQEEKKKKKVHFFTSDSYKVAHKALRLSPALTSGRDFCLQGGITALKDLSLN